MGAVAVRAGGEGAVAADAPASLDGAGPAQAQRWDPAKAARRRCDALAQTIKTLPKQLARSLTWDQGNEMSLHAKFTVDTGVAVYFCDPKSPWQRGSNENTNGLLRQYLPRTLDFRTLSQDDLDAIAAELNGRPRQTLGFKTPSEALNKVLR